jgi:Thioredoxin
VTVRILVAVALFIAAGGVAIVLERRRRSNAPTQGAMTAPAQLDRADFARPDAAWLVVLFTSETCMSCAGLYEKAATLASDDVVVDEVKFPEERTLHERYHVRAAPMTLVADQDGVVRASFFGAFSADELWNAVAALRA